MLVNRFADALKGGLLGLVTGKDMSQGVIPGLVDKDMSGGIAGLFDGDDYPSLTNIQKNSGGLTDFLYRHKDKSEIKNMPYYPRQNDGGLMQLPYYPGTQKDADGLHGFADFDGNYDPTFDIPGGPITSEEMQRMNKMYPIG